jgi:hypothetical protein
MKTNMIPVAAALFLLCATCCKKDELEIFEPGDQAYGTMQANKKVNWIGKETWTASGSARRDNTQPDEFFQISGYTLDKLGQPREELGILKIPLAVGTYPVFKNRDDTKSRIWASYARLVSDGDVVGAGYRANGSNNCITIDEIDTVLGIAKGSFRIVFSISEEFDDTRFPDKVVFSNGTFDLKFRD